MKKLGAREHMTFGHAVTAVTSDLVARAMVSPGKGRDLRNPAPPHRNGSGATR